VKEAVSFQILGYLSPTKAGRLNCREVIILLLQRARARKRAVLEGRGGCVRGRDSTALFTLPGFLKQNLRLFLELLPSTAGAVTIQRFVFKLKRRMCSTTRLTNSLQQQITR